MVLPTGQGHVLHLFVVYGYHCAEQDPEQLPSSKRLFGAVLVEAQVIAVVTSSGSRGSKLLCVSARWRYGEDECWACVRETRVEGGKVHGRGRGKRTRNGPADKRG